MEIYRDIEQLDVYKKVLVHRNYCSKWRSGAVCLDCFGGGLTKFTKDLLNEMKKKDIKIEANPPPEDGGTSYEIKDLKRRKLTSLKCVLTDAIATKKLVIVYAHLKEPEEILKATFVAEILSKQGYSCDAQIQNEEMVWNCKP